MRDPGCVSQFSDLWFLKTGQLLFLPPHGAASSQNCGRSGSFLDGTFQSFVPKGSEPSVELPKNSSFSVSLTVTAGLGGPGRHRGPP